MLNSLFLMIDFTDPGTWVSLVTLCFLEIVLGVDNIIFISIVTGKLPQKEQARARNIGMLLAMGFRVCLLLGINLIIALKDPVITIPDLFNKVKGLHIGLSYKDLILIAGGIFLLVKSVMEIHHKMNEAAEGGGHKKKKEAKKNSFGSILIQIVLVDAVFSFDSILTAVGLVDNVLIMIIAVIISMAIMMMFAGGVAAVINKYPTLQMLALSFLVVIGVVLIASGFHEEVNKSIIYSCLGFSIIVEMLNIRFRKKTTNAKND
ncbi:TerC family protein [Flavipsychrobacter stenotrophus]|nr:TerC family protein [Flavipsychrobacter stenotrophus]